VISGRRTASSEGAGAPRPARSLRHDGSQSNRKAVVLCDAENRLRRRSQRSLTPIRIRQGQYLNNRIEQADGRNKRRVSTDAWLQGVLSIKCHFGWLQDGHMMQERLRRSAFNSAPALKELFEAIAA
jgi:transposase-like protein